MSRCTHSAFITCKINSKSVLREPCVHNAVHCRRWLPWSIRLTTSPALRTEFTLPDHIRPQARCTEQWMHFIGLSLGFISSCGSELVLQLAYRERGGQWISSKHLVHRVCLMHSSVLPIYVWVLCNRSRLPLRQSNKWTWPTCEKELDHCTWIQNHLPRPLLVHPNLRFPPSVFVSKRRSGRKAIRCSATADWNLGTRLCKFLFEKFLPHPEMCCRKKTVWKWQRILHHTSRISSEKIKKTRQQKENVSCNTVLGFGDLNHTFVCQYRLSVLSHSRHCGVWFRFSGVFFFFFSRRKKKS